MNSFLHCNMTWYLLDIVRVRATLLQKRIFPKSVGKVSKHVTLAWPFVTQFWPFSAGTKDFCHGKKISHLFPQNSWICNKIHTVCMHSWRCQSTFKLIYVLYCLFSKKEVIHYLMYTCPLFTKQGRYINYETSCNKISVYESEYGVLLLCDLSTICCTVEGTVGVPWSCLLPLGRLLEHITKGLLLPSASLPVLSSAPEIHSANSEISQAIVFKSKLYLSSCSCCEIYYSWKKNLIIFNTTIQDVPKKTPWFAMPVTLDGIQMMMLVLTICQLDFFLRTSGIVRCRTLYKCHL
jgi:hypothetical protein